MSANKSATRRVSLLAGSSLVAATLAMAGFTGAVVAPGAAFAANECAPVGVAPSVNGAVADTYACTGATTYQATGITYSSQGNLTVNSTGAMDVGSVGVNLSGATTDNVTFTATGLLTGTSGAVVDITTTSGNITTIVGGVNANAAGVTNAVRMESTGAGNITFTRTSAFGNAAPINNRATGAEAAIAAITHGGNITLNISTQTPTGPGAGNGIEGRLRGVLAQTSGAGAVVLNISGFAGVTNNVTDGIAAVDIVAGTGGVDINLTTNGNIGGLLIEGSPGSANQLFDALGLRVVSAGAVTVDNTRGRVMGEVDFSGVTAGGVRFENQGGGGGTSPGGAQYRSGGTWHMAGDSVFTSQADLLILSGIRLHRTAAVATIDFGAGADTFNMSGIWIVGDVALSNLEAFNNSGTIRMGGNVPNSGDPQLNDGLAQSRLSMPGATFTGSGASRVIFDVVMDGTEQSGCGTLTGAADCLDLRDVTTAGSTIVEVNDASGAVLIPGYAPNGVTLVDVSGGTTGPSHFTLDPASTKGYVSPFYGPAIERPGEFVYIFRYDADNQRFVLVGQPKDRDLFDYAMLSGAAQSIWHMTTSTVTDRNTELRDRTEATLVWVRTAGEVTRRDQTTAFEGFDGTLTFDNSYKLYAGTIMAGMDLLSGGGEAFDYVLGWQAGYVSSSFDMEASESSGRFTGATGGLYGSVWSDWFFADGTVNLNGLALDYQHPSLGSKTTTYVNSIGAAAEAGTRTMLTENTFVEPLAALSWVRTSFEEISLLPGEVQPADAESLRAGLGLRLGATLPGQSVSASYFVTGRAWQEFEGENTGVVHNPGVDMPFADDFTGTFGEAELGFNIFNAANTLSGFGTTGVKFKEGYSAVNLSLGVRLAW